MEHVIDAIDGTRRNTSLYHRFDGYFYYLNKWRVVGNLTRANLRCKDRYRRRCTGTALMVISNDAIRWTNLQCHSCAPDRNFHQVLELRRQILEASVNRNGPYETPSQLVNRVRERFHVDVAARVTVARMRAAISRVRGNLYPPVPATLEQLGHLLINNPHLTAIQDGGGSFFAGMVQGEGTTSLVFLSPRIRRYLARTRIVSCDGTFSSRPHNPPSSQLLQIVGVIDNHAVPLVQVLMTGKSQLEYELVLRYIQELVPQFRPRIALTDFEPAMMNAWRLVYLCLVIGCYWHFCRAVTLKVRMLGLTVFLRGDRVARSIVRSLLGIPLLPQRFMARGVRVLMTEAHHTGRLDALRQVFNYFIDTWFSASNFRSLSVFRAEHRTNNTAETANKMFIIKTGAHRPGLWHFMDAVRRYEREAFISQRTLDAALPLNRPRTVQAINNDLRIRGYTRQLLQGRISIRTFLHRASTRVLNVYDFFLQPQRNQLPHA